VYMSGLAGKREGAVEKLRVGIAGLGRGRLFAEELGRHERCELVAVCDAREAALAPFGGVAQHTDYEAFLGERLDVVAVVTPGPVHAGQSVRALEAGAHVLCETPCVYSLDEAKILVKAVRDSSRSFMLAEDYLWKGCFRNLKDRAEEGRFGEIVYAEGDYTHDCRNLMLATDDGFVPYRERDRHPHARKTWRATDLPPLLYASHTLGPLLYLMDDRVVSAVALGTGCRTAPELGTTDLEAGLFRTARGSVIRLTNGFSLAYPMATHYSLAGTRGSARIDRSRDESFVWYSEATEGEMSGWESAPEAWRERPDGRSPLDVMVDEFVGGVVRGEAPPLDVHRSLDFVLPGVVAHASAEQGAVLLDVPDSREWVL